MNEVALCTCGKLLIYQQYFRELTWLCLACGNLFGRPPRKQPATPDSELRWRALEAEFIENCGRKLMVIGMLREDCARCAQVEYKRDPLTGDQLEVTQDHIVHASRQDWIECNDALKWLSDRTGREFLLVNGDMAPQ